MKQAVAAVSNGAASRPADAKPKEARTPWLLLAIIVAVYSVSVLDRSVFQVVLVPIKHDLRLSDTMLGFITGFGFVILNVVVSIPLARWADTGNRYAILTAGLTIWSVLTALFGAAQNAVQLLLLRGGLGVSEAVCQPASQSLITDTVPKRKRPMAMAIYALGPLIGSIFAGEVGGWISYLYNWRLAFVAAAIPGVILAFLVSRISKRHGYAARRVAPAVEQQGTAYTAWETVRFLLSQKSFVLATIGITLTGFSTLAFSAWTAPFLVRVHHLNQAQVGSIISFVAIPGVLGVLLGAAIVGKISKKSDARQMLAPAIYAILTAPCLVLYLLSNNLTIALSWYVISLLVSGIQGPVYAVLQGVAKPGMRALAAALSGILGSLIDVGLAPVTVGMLNDALLPRLGITAVRYSLLVGPLMFFLGGLFFWYASKFVAADMKRAAGEPVPIT